MEQFGMSRQPRLPGQQKDRFWRAVVLCALTAAVFFLPFYIMDGGFFHYAGDFNSQQISFYRYMNGFLKGAGYPDSTFAGAPRNTFSWATDLGSGAMNAYSFYLYGSPFFWFSILFPQRWLPYLMVPLLVLKFGVAGGGAFLYLRRYVKNENYAVLGACLYALSGFAVYNVFFNHFVDVVALFPYLLWALDEAIYENRHGLFAFWVAVNLLNNYFFFVGQVIFLCIYFVCKLTAKDFRLTGRKFGHLLWESVLGVAMGCLLLFPAVLSLLQNPRTIDLSSGWGFLTYAKVQQYLAILLSWVMPPDSPYLTSIWSEGVIKWTSMSAYLPLCSLAGALAYWRACHGDSKKRIVAVCAVCALVPILNSAFYALNSSYYARWYYMPVLILAAMTVNALEDHNTDLDTPARGLGWIMLATLAFALVPVLDNDTGTWSLGVLKNPGQYFVVLGFGLGGLLLYRLICQKWRADSRFAQRMTAAVLVFACVFRITGVPVYLAFLFGGIVLATAPAPSLSIVNELKTNGPVTRTLMPMAALDDLVGATVFFVVVALVSAQISSVGIPVAGILVLVFLPVPLGGAMGFWAGCRMCRARTPAPGLWYHAGPACSHRRTGRAGKCASAGSCAELHAAGHVLFRGICQLHSRRPSGKHHACDESRHRGGADCGHFEPGCAAGLSSDFRRGDLYCRVHSGAGCGQVQRGLSGGRRDRRAQNRAQFSGLCPAAALRRVAGIHRYRGIRSERSRPRVRFHPAGTIAAAAVINEVIAVFIAVRRSWDVWSGIPVHLQVFWQMSAIVVMYWQEKPLHRTF